MCEVSVAEEICKIAAGGGERGLKRAGRRKAAQLPNHRLCKREPASQRPFITAHPRDTLE
jgi:hypothetical protein